MPRVGRRLLHWFVTFKLKTEENRNQPHEIFCIKTRLSKSLKWKKFLCIPYWIWAIVSWRHFWPNSGTQILFLHLTHFQQHLITHTVHRIISIRCSITVVQARGFATGLLWLDNQYKPAQAFFMTNQLKSNARRNVKGLSYKWAEEQRVRWSVLCTLGARSHTSHMPIRWFFYFLLSVCTRMALKHLMPCRQLPPAPDLCSWRSNRSLGMNGYKSNNGICYFYCNGGGL